MQLPSRCFQLRVIVRFKGRVAFVLPRPHFRFDAFFFRG
jgi:hypothetical protein